MASLGGDLHGLSPAEESVPSLLEPDAPGNLLPDNAGFRALAISPPPIGPPAPREGARRALLIKVTDTFLGQALDMGRNLSFYGTYFDPWL